MKNLCTSIKDFFVKKPAAKHFFIRLAIFLILYTGISFYHPNLIYYIHSYSVTVTDKWLFLITYPILLFFIFIRWPRIRDMEVYKNSITETIAFSICAGIAFTTPIFDLVKDYNYEVISTYFLPVYLGYVFLFLAVFNINFIHKFATDIKILSLVLFSYLGINVAIEEYWTFFSTIIINVLAVVLPWIEPTTLVNPENFNIKMRGFSVFVGPPCAGIYSIVTFVLLFGLAVQLARKANQIHKSKTILAFATGILLVFLFNIVRVGIIVYVGAFHSPELALELFHEYLSSIFLIGIFAIYLYWVLPRICIPKKMPKTASKRSVKTTQTKKRISKKK